VICSQYYNLYPSIAVISPATKNIEYIGGYKEYVDGTLFTFTFENDYTTIMTSKIEGVKWWNGAWGTWKTVSLT